MRSIASCLALAALTASAGAVAGAPPPARPVATSLYSGRWYEIARSPNARQRGCEADTSDFAGRPASLSVVETCHQGAPSGPSRTLRTSARVLPGSGGARFAMSFLGGLIHQQYWILDHADDNAWAIMATPGGHYVWLLARRPVMTPAARAAAVARLSSLGYDPARLIFPPQQGRQ